MARFGRFQGAQRLDGQREAVDWAASSWRDAEDDRQVLGIRYSAASKMIDGEAKEAILPSLLLWLVLRIKGPLYSIPRSNVELNVSGESERRRRHSCVRADPHLIPISVLLVGGNKSRIGTRRC